MDMILVLLLLAALLLHPTLVWHGRKQAACWLFVAVLVLLVCRHQQDREGYDKMDFFPWNEARIVKKRNRESTVIDCGWSLDQPTDNIFSMDDPVIREYAS